MAVDFPYVYCHFFFHFSMQGSAIDRILGEIVHSKPLTSPIDYVLCIGHFLEKVKPKSFIVHHSLVSSGNSLSN